jgi:type IV pilus assembly protein PilA
MLNILRTNNLHINKEINMQNLQTMKQSVQKGFTLIELMIVVAIIGILAALAIPAYTDYTIKSRVSEGASLVGSAKTAIEVYWSENGTMTKQDGSGDVIEDSDVDFTSQSAEYVSSVRIIDDGNDNPIIVVSLRHNTAKLGALATGDNTTGGADGGCFRYFPTRGAGTNINWDVGDGGCETFTPETGAATATDAIAPKYMPKT